MRCAGGPAAVTSGSGFEQLAFDHVVDVGQPVVVGQFALEQVVHALDDVNQVGISTRESTRHRPFDRTVVMYLF